MPSDRSLDPARLSNALVRWFAELTYQGMFATDREPGVAVLSGTVWMELSTNRGMQRLSSVPTA